MRLLLCALLLTTACAALPAAAEPTPAAAVDTDDGTREVTVEWRGVI